jgi:hypothetical protein
MRKLGLELEFEVVSVHSERERERERERTCVAESFLMPFKETTQDCEGGLKSFKSPSFRAAENRPLILLLAENAAAAEEEEEEEEDQEITHNTSEMKKQRSFCLETGIWNLREGKLESSEKTSWNLSSIGPIDLVIIGQDPMRTYRWMVSIRNLVTAGHDLMRAYR